MSNRDVFAMISLLDDPDENVVSVVKEGLLKEGVKVIPILEEAWEGTVNSLFQSRIENVIQYIQFREVKKDLYDWSQHRSDDLLYGVYLLTRFQYPQTSYVTMSEQIEEIAKEIWLELHEGLTAMEKIKVINKILFQFHSFSPLLKPITTPSSYHFSYVLEQRRGGAMGLGVLYLCLAYKLSLPVSGVILPNNFILAYEDDAHYESLFEDNVLFYVDPLSKGTLLGRKEIELYLKRVQASMEQSYFTPCSNQSVLVRMIEDLLLIHGGLDQEDKLVYLAELKEVLI